MTAAENITTTLANLIDAMPVARPSGYASCAADDCPQLIAWPSHYCPDHRPN